MIPHMEGAIGLTVLATIWGLGCILITCLAYDRIGSELQNGISWYAFWAIVAWIWTADLIIWGMIWQFAHGIW